MKFISNKTKQFLVLIIKIIIVALAFYFIYDQLSNNKSLDLNVLRDIIKNPKNIFWIFLLLFLTFLNRFIEILKWQNLASLVRKISISEAAKQVLSALTLGLFTPNGIGEYAGKALHFRKKDTKEILFLNVICNGVQIIYALVFGFISFLYLNYKYHIISNQVLFIALLIISTILLLALSFRNIKIKGYSIRRLTKKIQKIPKKVHRKNLALGFLRYITFTHQYVILYYLFGVELNYIDVLCSVSAIYLFASSLPNFQFLEFAVKGSIAIYIFNILGVNQWIVAFVATIIWLLNIVLPVSIGSYFVMRFKLSVEEKN